MASSESDVLMFPMRARIALLVLRRFGNSPALQRTVVWRVYDWIDAGMSGPVPWPSGSAAFDAWAAANGLVEDRGGIRRVEWEGAA
jgi:hypothetical protein